MDFTALLNDITTPPPGWQVVRPTESQLRALLRKFEIARGGFSGIGFSELINFSLVEVAPLTSRQKTVKRKGQRPKTRYRLNGKGAALLAWLDSRVALVVDGHWANNPAYRALEPLARHWAYEGHLETMATVAHFHRSIRMRDSYARDLLECPF
jgi:hypothetical protein